MGASVKHEEFKAVVILSPYHEPVAFNVALPYPAVLTTQDMWTVFGRELTITSKNGDGIIKKFHIKTTLCTPLDIFSECSCIFNVVHIPRLISA